MLAPKITHQIWIQGWDKLPEKFQKNVSLLHELNPEFQHMQWTDVSLRDECAKLGTVYLKIYDGFTILMSKVDFGRYVVLYNYGGISIDTDMEPLRPIRDTPGLDKYTFMVSSSPLFPRWCNLVNNALIISTKKHTILEHMLNEIISTPSDPVNYILNELYVTNTTGPLFMNRIIQKFSDKIHLLENYLYEPCFSGDMFCTDTSESIMNHRHELSWMNPVTKFILRNIHYILLFLIFAVFNLMQFKHSFQYIGKNDDTDSKSSDLVG